MGRVFGSHLVGCKIIWSLKTIGYVMITYKLRLRKSLTLCILNIDESPHELYGHSDFFLQHPFCSTQIAVQTVLFNSNRIAQYKYMCACATIKIINEFSQFPTRFPQSHFKIRKIFGPTPNRKFHRNRIIQSKDHLNYSGCTINMLYLVAI